MDHFLDVSMQDLILYTHDHDNCYFESLDHFFNVFEFNCWFFTVWKWVDHFEYINTYCDECSFSFMDFVLILYLIWRIFFCTFKVRITSHYFRILNWMVVVILNDIDFVLDHNFHYDVFLDDFDDVNSDLCEMFMEKSNFFLYIINSYDDFQECIVLVLNSYYYFER